MVVIVEDIVNNLSFPGQYFDSESGLYCNWHRSYDPETGRYISADPIGLAGGVDTRQTNTGIICSSLTAPFYHSLFLLEAFLGGRCLAYKISFIINGSGGTFWRSFLGTLGKRCFLSIIYQLFMPCFLLIIYRL